MTTRPLGQAVNNGDEADHSVAVVSGKRNEADFNLAINLPCLSCGTCALVGWGRLLAPLQSDKSIRSEFRVYAVWAFVVPTSFHTQECFAHAPMKRSFSSFAPSGRRWPEAG